MIEFAGLTGLIGELAHQRLIDADNRHEDVLDNLCFAEAAEAEMNLMEVVFHIVQLVLARTATLIPLDMRSGITIFRNLIEEGRYA